MQKITNNVTLFLTALLVGTEAPVEAAQISVSNFDPLLPIGTHSGGSRVPPRVSPSLFIGSFGTLSDAEVRDLLRITPAGNQSLDFMNDGPFERFGVASFRAPGLFDVTVEGDIPSDSPLVGQNIWVIPGEDLAFAFDNFSAVRFDAVFEADDPEFIISLDLGAGEIVAGEIIQINLPTGDGGRRPVNALCGNPDLCTPNPPCDNPEICLVPEPSSTLLGAFGLGLLMIRRRRTVMSDA